MILARITRAVREQNWFAVALEFIIVIAGVVIGFQVTAWNSDRADREAEHIYLTRLHHDMERSVCQILRERDGVRSWNERARRTLDALLLNDPGAVADTGFEMIASTRIQTGSPFRATLNELVSGGQMNLVSNEELRAQIAETDAELSSLADYIQILVNTQAGFVGQVHSRLRPMPGVQYGITYDFEALSQDDEFINSLGHALRITYANSNWLGDMADSADRLRVSIGEDLGLDMTGEINCDAHEETTP